MTMPTLPENPTAAEGIAEAARIDYLAKREELAAAAIRLREARDAATEAHRTWMRADFKARIERRAQG